MQPLRIVKIVDVACDGLLDVLTCAPQWLTQGNGSLQCRYRKICCHTGIEIPADHSS